MAFHIEDFGTIMAEHDRLDKMKDAAKFMSPVMKNILIDMARATEALIRSQGRRGGGSWAPLKEGTVRKKGMTQILYTSGANSGYSSLGGNTLVRSVTNKTGSNAYSVRSAGQDYVLFGTNRPFAESHQYGAPSRRIPRREFLRFTEYDVSRWHGWILDHVTEPHRRK